MNETEAKLAAQSQLPDFLLCVKQMSSHSIACKYAQSYNFARAQRFVIGIGNIAFAFAVGVSYYSMC